MKRSTSFSVVSGTFLLAILILPITGNALGEIWVQSDLEEVIVDERIDLYFVVFNSTNKIEGVRLTLDDEMINVNISIPDLKADGGWFAVCYAELSIGNSGAQELQVQLLINGSWHDAEKIDINVRSDDKDDDENTIFGLPRWYCSVSIIGITVIVIFFTWSYFKGRKMQKEKVMATGNTSIQCSECGKDVGTEEKFCPWCGVSLDEEEFVCGKCSKPVSKTDVECPNCGTRLLKQKETPKVSVDKKPKKKKSKDLNMKEKRTCSKCETVLMKKEKVCPICGKKEV